MIQFTGNNFRADSQPKQNIPVEVYNKPSSSSAHSARAETADIRAAAAADTKSKKEDSESQDLHCDSVRIKNAGWFVTCE